MITKIEYPTPLSAIEDIENDNIDVFVELDDGITYTLVAITPANYIWYMDKEKLDYFPPGPPFITVKALTEEIIKTALEAYVENNAYWLKLYYLAGERNGVFDIHEMDKMIKALHSDDE